MKRRAALLAVAALLLVIPAAPARAQDTRPNVVVIMTDDQTLESMRAMDGTRRVLGRQGTTFERAFVSNALCCPSRATFFTGQYSHSHGVIGNRPPQGGYGALDTREWLPVWLQRAGYRTIHIGKFLNGYGTDRPATEVPPGWTEWSTSVDPSTYNYFGYTLNENGILAQYGLDGNPLYYSSDFYTQRAVDAIGRMSRVREPFFLSLAYLAPHSGGPRDPDDPAALPTPSPAPRHMNRFAGERPPADPSFNELDVSDKPAFIQARPSINAVRAEAIEENYEQRLESLLAVDEGVVRVVQALREAGELSRTLIMFTSDNGFFHGEHRLPNGKVLGYEPSIRVPLLMRGPGVPRGARRRQLVTNADLAPTILEATGATAAGRVPDGRSLFPLLSDPGLEWGRDLLVEGTPGVNQPAFDALRTYRYIYLEYDSGDVELYDLERDPYQLESLHADPRHARLRRELAARLALLAVCRGRSCRTRPRAQISFRGCRPRVRGRRLESVRVRARAGSAVRARVRTRDGRVVTLDRPLPPGC